LQNKTISNLNNFSSKLVENAVNELSKLPGIGRKTALRLALHLLNEEKTEVELLANGLLKMKEDVIFCKICHNISDVEICNICANPRRDASVICVVEDIRDVMAIENTSQFNGLYHVLGGIISPMDGVGPNDITIKQLVERIKNGNVNEVILALSATIEGDTTNYYIFRQLKDCDVSVSAIARGVAVGDELEYADEVTLGRSIINRLPYENSIRK
jgi:recombination protein RecR